MPLSVQICHDKGWSGRTGCDLWRMQDERQALYQGTRLGDAAGVSDLEFRDRPSPNHGDRGEAPNMRPVNMLVLHYTGMTSAAAALDRLCDAGARVSAHYLVDEDGTLWRLVPEARRAFHAGISCWQGDADLNLVSIS